MTDKIKNIVVVCLLGALVFGMAAFAFLKPADNYSESERRLLDKLPAFTVNSVLSGKFMSDFESGSVDQFPLRDKFRTLKALSVLYVFGQSDNNDIYIEDGILSKMEYELNEAMLKNAADKFRFIYETYLKENCGDIYFTIVPDKNVFLAEDSGHLSLDYGALESYMRENTEYMEYIDISGLLTLEDYYNTDTHWRQEKITDAAQKLAEAMGTEISGSYKENTSDYPFYGVYCGQSALPVEPDTLKYLTSDILDECIVTSWDAGAPVIREMYDMEAAAGRDPYEMFLCGTSALVTVENPNAGTDKELILFRDSFGGSIAPLLAEGYAQITLVDIRYISSSVLGQFIEFDGQDVLFMYSTLLLNNSMALR